MTKPCAVDDTPIVRFINKVLLDAIKQGASDIHFEPYEKDYRVRFRTDGILREWCAHRATWHHGYLHALR